MATAPRLTLDEFLKREESEPYSEYVCGEVIQKPMPDKAHSIIQRYLLLVIYQFLTTTRLGEILPEWRCIFGPAGQERAFIPDLTYVSRERLAHGDARQNRYLYAAPDIAIEILSPEQSAARFAQKVNFYLRHGVKQVWVIDPAEEEIVVLPANADPITLTVADALEGGDLLPGFSVPVAEIFAQLRVGP